MGSIQQFNWIKNNIHLINSPILEIGSRYIAKNVSMDYRSLFKDSSFTGIDMFPGNNVDKVIDLTWDFDRIKKKIGGLKFNAIICCSVFEHIDNIFKAADNLSKLTNKNGILFISVPFVWEFHAYPDDFWRFTPQAIKYLFPEFSFKPELSTLDDYFLSDKTYILPEDGALFNSIVTAKVSKPSPKQKFWHKFKSTQIKPEIQKRLIKFSMINMVGIKN